MDDISITFSALGSTKPKLLSLVPFETLTRLQLEPLRSLNLEHVSPEVLGQQEIQRHTPLGVLVANALNKNQPIPESTTLALLRKWYWARKTESAFLLTGFPMSPLHAKIFDEWLETRGEAIDGVLCEPAQMGSPVGSHYRQQGILLPLAA